MALLYMILFAIIIFNKNKISEVIVNEIISVLTAIEDKKRSPIMNKQQTPLEKLISDKNRLQERCTQEQKLNADFTYIQENAASLLVSGFSALVSETETGFTQYSANSI